MTNCNMKTERANILEILGKPRFLSNFLLSYQIKPHQRLKNNVWGECPVIHRRKVYLELVNQAAISIWDKINELFVSTAVTLASPCLSRLSSLRSSGVTSPALSLTTRHREVMRGPATHCLPVSAMITSREIPPTFQEFLSWWNRN